MNARPPEDNSWLPKKAVANGSEGTTAAQWLPHRKTLGAAEQSEPESLSHELLKDLERFIKRFVLPPPHAYLPLALWALATHAGEIFDCFPYIAAISAVKRSGKTRLAEVLELFVRKPWRGTAPSPAALYRMLEGAPTLMLDEVEALNGRNKSETTQILLAVLNAGHRKGSTIPRCEGPRQEVRQFPVYGPKFFAAIGRLPDTLLDRSIVVHMKRRSKTQPVQRFRMAQALKESEPIKERIEEFMEAHTAAIERAYERVLKDDLEFLNDRDADLWTPLFSVCKVMDSDRLPELKRAAIALSQAKSGDDVDDSHALTLLRDIRTVWPDGEEKCETALLMNNLKGIDDAPWGEQPYPLTARKLARMLRPFEVEPRTLRIETRTPKGYLFEHLKEAFDLYLD